MGIFLLEAQKTFPGTLKVNMINVLYFFVIYRLYLNYNAKLTAERQVINHRHKILQQCYSNTDVLSENLLLEKSKELLKINLVFRACLLAESFLLKLNRPWLCASNLIISTKTLRKTPIDEYILRKCRLLLEHESIAYFFVRFIFFAFPKVSRNCRWRSHFFTKTQSYSPQNSTKPHHRCFHEDVLKHLHRKLWKISRKTY